ncbi:hypothetical protein [Pseudomonas sp. ANT_H12B]|uniref:hypothetical protein n=1 Tax=Pseudomonas sp. ANT_H12B TaxID=2597348 RepID=UPI0011EE54B7|nr:hypothetical protein [Pseudomonas sp. ANT_H12B]KAA0980465.1 hypothetical protein FQ185_02465 [Pseudomonas sp. ANT_H12B]
MTTPELPDNHVMALYPPRIPRGTESVVGAHYGIPLHIYDLEPIGLIIEVLAYFGQLAGDTVRLNLNGQSDIVNAKTQSDNSNTTLYLPKNMLLADALNQLTYTVVRGSQNMGTSTPLLTMLYNAIRPGNQDSDPGVEGHSRLELLLPDAIKNGVGADFVSAQVCVSYPYCRAHDEIRLNCNGHDVFHTVTEAEAPLPGSDTPVTVCFPVTRADLSGGDSATFKFSFTVTDQLKNSPDTDSPWSATTEVDVDLAGKRLPAAVLREIREDTTDDPGLIDLVKLGSKPLLLIVLTAGPRFQRGDTINATYTAKIEGQPDVVVTVSGVVEADDFGQKNPCILEVANDKVLADSMVTVVYDLLRGGALVGSSKMAMARVTGEAVPEFNAPKVREAEPDGSTLQPVKAKDTLTVVVPVQGTRPADLLSVTFAGAPGTPAGGSHTTPAKPISEVGLNIALPVSVLAFNLGKPVTVTFTITRDGKSYTSRPLALNIGTLPASVLNSPIIEEADNAGNGPFLNVNSLITATFRMSDWPLIARLQFIWIRLQGTNNDGTPYEAVPSSAPGSYVNQAWIDLRYFTKSLNLSQLKNLKHGSSLSITFKAALGGSRNESEAVTFPVQTYSVISDVNIDTSLMQLQGRNPIAAASLNWEKRGDAIGSFAQRIPQGGRPPYTYFSYNAAIATVDNTGTVRSVGNGATVIRVRDSSKPAKEKSYPVQTSNVFQILHNPEGLSHDEARSWISSVGGSPIQQYDTVLLAALKEKYIAHSGSDIHITGRTTNGFPHTLRRTGYKYPNQWIWQSAGGTSARAPAICIKALPST